eukprot:Lithocolla_globosa_v1_NODE_841_length_3201_cov_10.126828.p4 type:complete len:139 gc:universal NODE_841_length_3201_cov_10.126828:2573-2157(-)
MKHKCMDVRGDNVSPIHPTFVSTPIRDTLSFNGKISNPLFGTTLKFLWRQVGYFIIPTVDSIPQTIELVPQPPDLLGSFGITWQHSLNIQSGNDFMFVRTHHRPPADLTSAFVQSFFVILKELKTADITFLDLDFKRP